MVPRVPSNVRRRWVRGYSRKAGSRRRRRGDDADIPRGRLAKFETRQVYVNIPGRQGRGDAARAAWMARRDGERRAARETRGRRRALEDERRIVSALGRLRRGDKTRLFREDGVAATMFWVNPGRTARVARRGPASQGGREAVPELPEPRDGPLIALVARQALDDQRIVDARQSRRERRDLDEPLERRVVRARVARRRVAVARPEALLEFP